MPIKRIEWIDLAKGICIFLVVLHHIELYYGFQTQLSIIVKPLRMPLYFVLSGIFFKEYDGLWGFIKRKINKLIVPYLFFFTTLGVLLPCIFYNYTGYKIDDYWGFSIIKGLSFVFSENPTGNTAIWFLVCLFEVNLIFYTIRLFFGGQKLFEVVSVCFMGILGICCCRYNYGLPYFLDSSFSALPFFYFGYILKNETKFFQIRICNVKNYLSFFIFVGFVLLLIYKFRGRIPCGFFANGVGGFRGALMLYISGIIGSLAILLIANVLTSIPLISYIGRYSIIVLCTHAPLYCLYDYYLIDWLRTILPFEGVHIVSLFTYLLTMFSYLLLIPFCLRVLPYVTAQKGLLKV